MGRVRGENEKINLLEVLVPYFELTNIDEDIVQIKRVNDFMLNQLLNEFGENRSFVNEGDDIDVGEIKSLIDALRELQLERLPIDQRNQILTSFQSYLVDRIRDFHNRQKIKLVYNPKLSTWQMIYNLLETAKIEGKAGYVAQHLVGAKLQLRFPNLSISNESVSTADQPTNRNGDFLVGNTVFHVTVSPMQAVFEKCQANLEQGFKVYLLVPDAKLAAARQLGDQFCAGQISVESLESFLSQNIDELSTFTINQLKEKITSLLRIYNERVDSVEIDKSLMIELPSNLDAT